MGKLVIAARCAAKVAFAVAGISLLAACEDEQIVLQGYVFPTDPESWDRLERLNFGQDCSFVEGLLREMSMLEAPNAARQRGGPILLVPNNYLGISAKAAILCNDEDKVHEARITSALPKDSNQWSFSNSQVAGIVATRKEEFGNLIDHYKGVWGQPKETEEAENSIGSGRSMNFPHARWSDVKGVAIHAKLEWGYPIEYMPISISFRPTSMAE